REGDRQRHRDVVAGAPEDAVRRHVHEHDQVAGGPAALSGLALALQLDPLAVRDTGGDAHPHPPRADRLAAALTRRARIVDDQTPAATLAAGLGEREAAGASGDVSGALADRADARRRARLRAAAVAGRTRRGAAQLQR